jgi:beta-mannanase
VSIVARILVVLVSLVGVASPAAAAEQASATIMERPALVSAVNQPSALGLLRSAIVFPARLQYGVVAPGGPTAEQELDALTQMAGEAPAIISSFYDFAQEVPWAGLNAAAARNAISLITWEPWRWGASDESPYALSRIARGDFDPYVTSWARALKTRGHPVMLRFAHEMNLSAYPWSEGVNGNSAGQYIQAWRHVHDVFTRVGAANVSWVWSPNVPRRGSPAFHTIYPGPAYVDFVALDGYNFGTTATWSHWTSPDALFAQGLKQLRDVAPRKPILITETASAEQGGSKPAWITSAISYLSAQSDVKAFIWFNRNKEVDWRIDSSAASAASFAQGLAKRPNRRSSA